MNPDNLNTSKQLSPPPGKVNAGFSPARVNRVVRDMLGSGQLDLGVRWLSAVAARVAEARTDIAAALINYLGAQPASENPLKDLTIGEISVCYEALLAAADGSSRKSAGQFFTPDDAAQFMASQSSLFPKGVWLDPCSGVGNLAWHLTAKQADPIRFAREALVLIDKDPVALRTAVTLIAAEFSAPNDVQTVQKLARRSSVRDFLSNAKLPKHDFVIFNPPYVRTGEDKRFESGPSRDLFAYFSEKVAKESRGFIGVTPASYLSAPKFASLRTVLDRERKGGDIFVFDNVPDTLFRGYKFGSNNTSTTNFVRAAITVSPPTATSWRITPILRWQSSSRSRMFADCRRFLGTRRTGPNGEWVKLMPSLGDTWDRLAQSPQTLADLIHSGKTEYSLDVALTPRYFISASFRPLARASKTTLYFRNETDRRRAAIVLNSSLPYLWWRSLDGGVTLPRRVLLSVPIPAMPLPSSRIVNRIKRSEQQNVVIKNNAGIPNENVKHSQELVRELNVLVLPNVRQSSLDCLYSNNMFSSGPLASTGDKK